MTPPALRTLHAKVAAAAVVGAVVSAMLNALPSTVRLLPRKRKLWPRTRCRWKAPPPRKLNVKMAAAAAVVVVAEPSAMMHKASWKV